MVRLLAILLSALVMGGLVYVFGAFVLLAMPLLLIAIVFAETHGSRQSRKMSRKKPMETETSTTSTER
ncbi:MAG: hypothetical protein H7340_00700 [Variovorax sp.]|nr:hypothetical protein [Variovorax sp.]